MDSKNRIILFEGVTGIGKSTTAQFIELQLKKNNNRCKWFHEMENNNPVGRPFHTNNQIEEIKNKWITFSNSSVEDDKTYLFDARYLNLVVSKMYDSNHIQYLSDYYSEINKTLIQNNPLLVYLYSGNIKKAIKNTYSNSRNYKDYITDYKKWKNINSICLDLISTFNYEKLLFNIDSYSWDDIYTEILKKLNIVYYKTTNRISSYEILIGEYKHKKGIFKIIKKNNELYLHDHPFFEKKLPFNKMDWKLIEIETNKFVLEGLNIFLNFNISKNTILKFVIDYKDNTASEYEKIL